MINHQVILNYFHSIFGPYMHARRVFSLANATLGVLYSHSLAIYAIGSSLAQVRNLERKHAIKQIDRLLTNTKLNVWQLSSIRVPAVVNSLGSIALVIDWIEFHADGHSTLSISMLTPQGAIPLLWKTYPASSLHGQRPTHERALLTRLKQALPGNIAVMVLTNSEHITLIDWAPSLGFHYIMGIEAQELVGYPQQPQLRAREWLNPTGRTRTLKSIEITRQRQYVERLYCYGKHDLNGPCFLASNLEGLSSTDAWRFYTQYHPVRPHKHHRQDTTPSSLPTFCSNMAELSITSPARRDRLLLLSALASDLQRSMLAQPKCHEPGTSHSVLF